MQNVYLRGVSLTKETDAWVARQKRKYTSWNFSAWVRGHIEYELMEERHNET